MGIIILFIISITSCSKSNEIELVNDCENLVELNCNFIQYTKVLPYVSNPFFLDGNNEIGFLEEVLIDGFRMQRLSKWNTITKERTVILNNINPVSKISRNANGSLAFSGLNWEIYLIRYNELQVIRLSNGPRDLVPRFNKTGTNISWVKNPRYENQLVVNDSTLIEHYNIRISGLNGIPIDSFRYVFRDVTPMHWQKYDWNSEFEFVVVYGPTPNSNYGIGLYNMLTNDFKILSSFNYESKNEVNDIVRHPNKDVAYYSNSFGISKINLLNGATTLIAEGKCNRIYNYLDISDDGKYLIASVTILSKGRLCEILESSIIIKINLSTWEETTVLS